MWKYIYYQDMTGGDMYYYILTYDGLIDGNVYHCQMFSFTVTSELISKIS